MVVSDRSRIAVVLDVGTGVTKAGFAGNLSPSHVFPTCVASKRSSNSDEDTDFFVGTPHDLQSPRYDLARPVSRGVVKDWSLFEKTVYSCLCERMQVDSREHAVLVTEPPLHPPEGREGLAEVLFETFDVPAIHIGVQAELALYGTHVLSDLGEQDPGSPAAQQCLARPLNAVQSEMTGVVVDAGAGVTHVVPIVNGYVVTAAIRASPVNGTTATTLIQRSLRDRGEPLPAVGSMEFCRVLKERLCYTCRDREQELNKLSKDPTSITRAYRGHGSKPGVTAVNVASERFMAPEVFFSPEIAGLAAQPLPELVDSAIQACPIDARRKLYKSISLSGGATRFQNFDRRLKLSLQRLLDTRLTSLSTGVPVSVFRHPMEKCAAWVGGSLLAASDDFAQHCYSRQQYQECGPSLFWKGQGATI